MTVSVKFACGHTLDADPDKAAPICHCGEKRIALVKAPNPRIVGTATGPLVETKPMEPGSVNLATDALKLKDTSKEEH